MSRSASRRPAVLAVAALVAAVAVAGGGLVLASGILVGPGPFATAAPSSGGGIAQSSGRPPAASASPSGPGGSGGAPSISPSPTPWPTSTPGPSLVPGPLDGLPTTVERANQHPIAVMVDDLSPARPQSGFGAASVVWQAPAEGGIPRYMMLFNENVPSLVGPIRSSRYYFIAWAAEWRAMYVHVGGSPQALATLAAGGHGQLVYNADGLRYEPTYLYRVHDRSAPHNEYSDARRLRRLAEVVGARDGPIDPAWTFAPDAPVTTRPAGATIDVTYPANHIRYAYDRATNTYRRSVTMEGAEKDAATGQPVAPKNVVVIVMHFGPLNDGHPDKKRLEADVIGSGPAWVATNGTTVKATWRKASLTSPTLLLDTGGRSIPLTAGQTFVQVVQSASEVRFVAGRPVGDPRPPEAARPS